jgi:hypothetical protein
LKYNIKPNIRFVLKNEEKNYYLNVSSYLVVKSQCFLRFFQLDGMDETSSSEDEAKMVIALEEKDAEKNEKKSEVTTTRRMTRSQTTSASSFHPAQEETRHDEKPEQPVKTMVAGLGDDDDEKPEEAVNLSGLTDDEGKTTSLKDDEKPKEPTTLNDMLYRLKASKQERYLEQQKQKEQRRQQQPERRTENFLGSIMTAQTSMFVQKQREGADGQPAPEIR